MNRLLILTLLLSAFTLTTSQDANCDFSANIQPGRPGYIYNTNYPQNYTPGVTCRWIAICPAGYQCRLDCSEINIPSTPGCSGDRLLVSKTGDPQLVSAEKYCGYGSLSLTSTGNRLSVGLISSRNNPYGGRFYCQVSAQLIAPSCSCGWRRSTRIVGGQETGINEFPFMVGVYELPTRQIKCGGALISTRHVITAAHCVINQPMSDFVAILGEHDTTIGDSPATQAILLSGIIIHPQYQPSTYDYDMAILVLQQDVQFSDRIGPICLPFKYAAYDFAGANVTLLGWGTIFSGGPTSNVLQKVDVSIISQAVCRTQVAYLTNRMICNYTPGKDACQHDSGGPVVYTDPQTGALFSAGVISHGQFCASSKPGVNTRTTQLLDWIVANTNYNFCRK